ncbi:MAG: hypothetical protein LBL66_01235 [Clostridiales bacterium]|jgi:hypothetical protein|nr:hypothetical protein [Clostridiales bacterium]
MGMPEIENRKSRKQRIFMILLILLLLVAVGIVVTAYVGLTRDKTVEVDEPLTLSVSDGVRDKAAVLPGETVTFTFTARTADPAAYKYVKITALTFDPGPASDGASPLASDVWKYNTDGGGLFTETLAAGTLLHTLTGTAAETVVLTLKLDLPDTADFRYGGKTLTFTVEVVNE